MSIQLNHTIIQAQDAEKSAKFLTEILGLPAAIPFGSFIVVKTSNQVSLDFRTTSGKIQSRHFAFLVSETEFDEIFKRINQKKLSYWADPGRTRLNQINRNDGGRGCYFLDPDGHFLEILTRPYGSSDMEIGTI
jgi:catechol 2,3-dioxygenase-like lactoylglutathione lyase family enzyme